MRQLEATLLALLILSSAAQTRPADYPGPYTAKVVRVLDADTFRARVKIWPTLTVLASVRLRGVDTPEKGFRARCAAERAAAERATRHVRSLLPPGTRVRLQDVRLGKFAGRIIATVRVRRHGRWYDLSRLLIRRGLGRGYDGGHRKGWCLPPRAVGKEDRLR